MSTSPRSKAEGAPLGPGSLLWAAASDPRGLLTGTAAGIMQLMLPSLGAGVTDHSNFFEDPYDRIFRSIPWIWGSIFATDEEGEAVGRQIRDFHPDIKGADDQGRRYHALDPDTYWWAHATFTWEFLRARELYHARPYTRAQQEQLYAESVTWYRRYGVSDRPVPVDLAAFERRFAQICDEELELTPAVRWVLEETPASPSPPGRLPGRAAFLNPITERIGAEALRVIVYGNLPDQLRRRFDLSWSTADRAKFLAVCGMFRSLGPAIRRGALQQMFPPETPRLAPGSSTRVLHQHKVSGPASAPRPSSRSAAGSPS